MDGITTSETFDRYNENREVFIQSEALKIFENTEDENVKLRVLELLEKAAC